MTDSVRRSQLPLLLVVRWSLTRVRSLVVVSLCVRCWFVCVRCWFVVGSLLRCCRCCVALRLSFVLRFLSVVGSWQLVVWPLLLLSSSSSLRSLLSLRSLHVGCWLLGTGRRWASLLVVGTSLVVPTALWRCCFKRQSSADHLQSIRDKELREHFVNKISGVF